MLTLIDVQNLLNVKGRSNHDRTLLCLGLEPLTPRTNSDICKIAKDAGWSSVSSATVATSLSRAKGLAIKTPAGWKLTDDGEAHIQQISETRRAVKSPEAALALRKHLEKIKSSETLAFVEEAVKCYEYGLLRSAVVMSWVGAVSLLYNYVIASKLAEFNTSAKTRIPKWKDAKTVDDLTVMQENDFLQILQDISVIGKTLKKQLGHCLDSRNACGHPNTFKIADSAVAAHVEVLLLNVYEKF